LLGAWYVHGLYTLWLAPLGLGVLYYLIPKISGLTLRFSSKTQFAFWTWVVFAPWTAVHDLVGGPFPASTVSFGLILSGLLFIPVALISISLVSTAFSGEDKHHGGIVLPFLSLAAVCFVAAGVSEQILSIRGANEYLRFTLFREANFFLWLYGFFSFLAFGAIYYIVPRLLNFGWRSSMLIRVHYYACVYGIGLLITMLAFGGIMQGLTLENTDPQVTISTVTELSTSFYISVTMCLAIVSIGTGIFAFHFGWTVLDWLHLQARTNRLAAEILKEDHVEPDAIPVAASQEASA
jgi:cytochrome c oxidase cbb3-type subunit 1